MFVYILSGLHPLRRILSQGHYELRIDIEDWAGETAYATYKVFEIGPSSDNFRLAVDMYGGTAGVFGLIFCFHCLHWAVHLPERTEMGLITESA